MAETLKEVSARSSALVQEFVDFVDKFPNPAALYDSAGIDHYTVAALMIILPKMMPNHPEAVLVELGIFLERRRLMGKEVIGD